MTSRTAIEELCIVNTVKFYLLGLRGIYLYLGLDFARATLEYAMLMKKSFAGGVLNTYPRYKYNPSK